VKATIKHAFEKLGVHDKAAAVLAHQAVHGICSRG
jgi:DNA-binding CsgD family transcriptional regulator